MKDEIVNGQRIRCYDNGGATYDRYSVLYIDQPCDWKPGCFESVCMSSMPFSPLGMGMHGAAMPGKHLGKRVPFNTLPEDCQKLVNQDLWIEEGGPNQ